MIDDSTTASTAAPAKGAYVLHGQLEVNGRLYPADTVLLLPQDLAAYPLSKGVIAVALDSQAAGAIDPFADLDASEA